MPYPWSPWPPSRGADRDAHHLAGAARTGHGASSGLGADFARELARRGANLVNNAGFGLDGKFSKLDWEREQAMLELDVIVPVHLTKLFLPGMLDRGFGFVLNVASIGAYQPSPVYASYSAAKSFVLNFTEALSYELRGSGVTATALSPGIVATEFLRVSGQQATRYQRLLMMDSPTVARLGIDAILKGRPSLVPGRLNAASDWSNRFLPRRMSAALAHRLMV